MSREKTDMTRISHTLPVLGSGVAVCLLIILEPNMSITMCVGLVMLIMLFIGGMKPKWFVFLLVAAAVAVPVMILVEPYRLKRLLAFTDPVGFAQGRRLSTDTVVVCVGERRVVWSRIVQQPTEILVFAVCRKAISCLGVTLVDID